MSPDHPARLAHLPVCLICPFARPLPRDTVGYYIRVVESTKRSLVTGLPFYYGWVIVAVASAAGFMSGPGQTYGVSVFVDPIIDDLGLSRTMVAGLYTAGSLTAATTMVVVGRLLDKFGARVMLAVVATLFGFAAIGMSNVQHVFHLYLGFAALRTLGQGSLSLISTTLVAIWFVRKRGKVTAIYHLGMAASQAAFPPLIYLLISNYGWRNAWVVLGFIIWAVVVLPSLLLVRRSPEAVGLLPDGDSASAVAAGGSSSGSRFVETNFSLREALATRSFWLLVFAGSSQSLISTALVFHHVSVMSSRGLDAGVAASILSVIAPLAIVGAFIAGFFADRLPNRYLLVVGQGLLCLAMLLTLVISQAWQGFIFGGMLGLAGGLFMTTNSVIWPNYYGRTYLGSIRGVVTTCMVAFAALGPLPFGILFDLTNGYTVAIFVFMALPVACGIAALFAYPPQKRHAAAEQESLL